MNVRRLCLFLGIAACSTFSAAQADAQGYFGAYYNGVPYSIYSQDTIPYFALHPPVYYSAPMSRPYGMSPFAYPPGSVLPPVATPQMVINSYVTQGEALPKGLTASTPMPKIIENPFVVGVKDPGVPSLPPPQPENPIPAPDR